MLSENMIELYTLLASIPGENPRVYGCGARFSKFDRRIKGIGNTLSLEVDDFPGTEALLRSEISTGWKIPLPAQG